MYYCYLCEHEKRCQQLFIVNGNGRALSHLEDVRRVVRETGERKADPLPRGRPSSRSFGTLNKDYQRLSGLTNASRARELFYPKSRDLTAVNENSPQLAGFLKNVDDHAYHSPYNYLLTSEGFSLPFANPMEVLKSMNSHGKTMQLVMTHVVTWLNDEPAKINHREGNKPPLIDDLIPNASEVMPESGSTVPEARTARARDGSRDLMRSLPVHAEQSVVRVEALDLQRDVLTYVEEHAASFTDGAKNEYLNLMPDDDMEPLDYYERFRAGPWREVLVKVQRAVGPGFKNACVVKFNTAAPDDPPSPPRISLADSLQRVVVQHPKVAHNCALNNPEAIEALRGMMDEVVARWAAKQNEKAILDRGPRRTPRNALLPSPKSGNAERFKNGKNATLPEMCTRLG